jgi:hypothetical protein
LGDRALLHFSGVFRRTEFVLRRDDLNLVLSPTGVLSDGRTVYGLLAKVGSLVAATPGSQHRFSDFGNVWALNSDGWSEYVGLTASLEVSAGGALDFFASYTLSSTEDNLVGARSSAPDAQLIPRLGGPLSEDWASGTSDFDLPHRFTAGALSGFDVLEGMEVRSVYRFESGWPFTPGYQAGVDVNGDGSGANDPALIPLDMSFAMGDSDCSEADPGAIARRNSCRGPGSHSLDVHVELGIAQIGSSVLYFELDAFNLADAPVGAPESALLLVDEEATLVQAGNVTTVPTRPNPRFGLIPDGQRLGRMVRFGLRLGLP